MTLGDVADLASHWRRFPPTHIAVRRLENITRACHGIPIEPVQETKTPTPPARRSLSDIEAMVDQMNVGTRHG